MKQQTRQKGRMDGWRRRHGREADRGGESRGNPNDVNSHSHTAAMRKKTKAKEAFLPIALSHPATKTSHTHVCCLHTRRESQTLRGRKESPVPPLSPPPAFLLSREVNQCRSVSYESIIHFSGRNDSIRLCDLNRLHPSAAIQPRRKGDRSINSHSRCVSIN